MHNKYENGAKTYQTPQNILRPCDAPEIRRIPPIANMDIPTPSRPADTSLRTGPSGSVPVPPSFAPELRTPFPLISPLLLLKKETPTRPQSRTGLGGEDGGLGTHFRVVDGMLANDGLQEGEEGRIWR